MAEPTAVTPEQLEILEAYEKGLRLQDTIQSAGWKDALDLMEAEVALAEFHLMNYNGVDNAELMALHRRARAMREFFQQTQVKIQTAVDQVEEIKRAVENPQLVTPIGTPGESW